MVLPQLAALTDLSLFLLRLMLAAVFGVSGWSHLRHPSERSEDIGMSVPFTAALGFVEVVGAVAIVLGVYTQLAALAFIGVMLGAIYKKAFVWKTGFWGDESQGWYYDLFYLVASAVVVTTGGGGWTLV